MSWYRQPAEGEKKGFVVVETRLGNNTAKHALPVWKRLFLERLSVLVSVAIARIMASVKQSLEIVMIAEDQETTRTLEWPWKAPDDQKWYLDVARFSVRVDEERAERIRKLLDQDEKGYGYTNAYRFVSIKPTGTEGWYTAIAELARGSWKESTRGTKHVLSQIQAKTGLQQLLMGYLRHPALMALPRALRAGVCQEVAQQVMSTIGQVESTKVRGEVAFPTTEDRDPARRRNTYERAIDALVRDARPLTRVPLRELDPSKFAADDPKGDKPVIQDERWFAVTRSPEPHPIPLFFVDPKSVRVQHGAVRFEADVSKADRHAGRTNNQRQRVFDDRPLAVQKKGYTCGRAFYAAIPVLDVEDPELTAILAERDERKAGSKCRGRGMDFQLANVPLHGSLSNRSRKQDLFIQLGFDRGRLERTLGRKDLSVAWTKIVKKDGEWYLQLTLRVPYDEPAGLRRVLGVSFGLDTVLTWVLVDEHGNVLETGNLGENHQIKTFLKKKLELEWNQEKGRWVGGRRGQRFAKALESIAHGVSNEVVALAGHFEAVIAVEDVRWVPKAGPDHEANVRFSAWNYGQLRNFLEYKAPIAGLGTPRYTSDYVSRFTCPKCGAMRGAKESKGKEKTFRVGAVLHCRKCGFEAELTPVQQARSVALHAFTFCRKKWEKEENNKE